MYIYIYIYMYYLSIISKVFLKLKYKKYFGEKLDNYITDQTISLSELSAVELLCNYLFIYIPIVM